MDSSKPELAYEFLPFLRVYKDGSIERLTDTDFVPPSVDDQTGVTSKDVLIIPEFNVSARIFIPPNLTTNPKKLPVVVYYHGGGFCIASAFCLGYHSCVNSLVLKANVVAVSVDYRLAPEHPIPVAYEDSWNAMKWVASHSQGGGPEAWLNEFADFNRVFLAGDSAGANIAHKMAMSAGKTEGALNMKLHGIALVHPYFWGTQPIGSEGSYPGKRAFVDQLWPSVCHSALGNDDPDINPMAVGASSFSSLGCSKALVCVAQEDILKDRGWLYYETLRKSGWAGDVEIMETEGEEHVFHLHNPTSEKATDLLSRLALFLNQ